RSALSAAQAVDTHRLVALAGREPPRRAAIARDGEAADREDGGAGSRIAERDRAHRLGELGRGAVGPRAREVDEHGHVGLARPPGGTSVPPGAAGPIAVAPPASTQRAPRSGGASRAGDASSIGGPLGDDGAALHAATSAASPIDPWAPTRARCNPGRLRIAA